MSNFKLFSGSANKKLTKEIGKHLNIEVGEATLTKFSDGEISVQIKESVRGQDVFIVQATCSPVNDTLMELLIMVDALKRSSAKSISAVMPYYGYARQDRKAAPRVPITAKLTADMLEKAGVHRVITIDLHAAQIQGFFNIPVDNLFGSIIFIDYIKDKKLKNPVIASPDIGGVARARSYAKKLNYDLVIVDKRREKANEAEVMNIIGDVKGKDIILVDDIVDTAGTLVKAAHALKEMGANSVMACCTHGVLSGKAYEKLNNGQLDELIISDTIPIKEKCDKITVLNSSEMLAQTIQRIQNNESVTTIFT